MSPFAIGKDASSHQHLSFSRTPTNHRSKFWQCRMILPEEREEVTSVVTTLKRSVMPKETNDAPQYSRELYLREEAESPFRKVRFFFYISLGAGAAVSLAVSLARIGAGIGGVNTDLLSESLTNAAVDLAGIVVLSFLYQRDLEAQDSRLKRASRGAELAKLVIKTSKSLVADPVAARTNDRPETDNFTTTLSAMRRGRGIEKRVVIAVGGSAQIDKILEDMKSLGDSLTASDLLVVPVLYPQAVAPQVDPAWENKMPPYLALPVGPGWKNVVNDETAEATEQGIDVASDGICIILKKNGKVGQRTKGIFLNRMVGDVESRERLGMDTRNI
jgi:Low psii accumulation1 / Rep27